MFESKVNLLKREFKMWCEKLEKNISEKERLEQESISFLEQLDKMEAMPTEEQNIRAMDMSKQISRLGSDILSCEAYLRDIGPQLDFYESIKTRLANLDTK